MNTKRNKLAIFGVVAVLRLTALFEPVALGQEALQTANHVSATPSTNAVFERTLRQFVTMAANDRTVSALLTKHRVTLEYTISDLGLQCYVGFEDGKVVGVFSRPPRQAELSFVSSSDALDRLLQGEDTQSEMQMTVHLNIVRKISLKHDFKQIRAALTRVYAAAGDKVSILHTSLAQSDVR